MLYLYNFVGFCINFIILYYIFIYNHILVIIHYKIIIKKTYNNIQSSSKSYFIYTKKKFQLSYLCL
jgi:hypothetical protein